MFFLFLLIYVFIFLNIVYFAERVGADVVECACVIELADLKVHTFFLGKSDFLKIRTFHLLAGRNTNSENSWWRFQL